MDLYDSVKKIPLIGNYYAHLLKKLEIATIEDLLFHIPSKYIDFSNKVNIKEAEVGKTATIEGEIEKIENVYTKKGKNIQIAKVKDSSGSINVIWFNQPYLCKKIKHKEKYYFSGKISLFNFKKAMISPLLEKKENGENIHTGRLIPIYPLTKGISNQWIRSRIKQTLDIYKDSIKEHLPKEDLKTFDLTKMPQAFEKVHFPQSKEEAKKAKERLALEELLKVQLVSLYKKVKWQKENKAEKLVVEEAKKEFNKLLPFELTEDQKRAIIEIENDLKKEIPMNRLLEGDVGSGKTVVAAFAAFVVAKNGKQTVLMAPTEILAKQHFLTFSKIFKDLKISLVTSSVKKIEKDAKIIIGTHALLHQKEIFKNTALVVIDEQHKFGVFQRGKLIKLIKGEKSPHILTMTATPIPRTIALTAYGHLDLSTINTMPKGRKKVITWIVPEEKRKKAYDWIKNKIKEEKEQIFVICPLIEESESNTMKQVKSAISEYEKLKKEFNNFKIEVLHGKLKSKEKDKIINNFRNKKIDILVSTPVVEVGIDIPNANIMIIEAADRFGLAQLHQLRGRIGRGKKQGYCLLFSESRSRNTLKRLSALKEESSGIKLAEIDLKLRGPGELWGTKQHGFPKFKAANWQDAKLIQLARKIALNALNNPTKYKKLLKKANIIKI